MATPTLVTSNRLETLARDLAETIRAPLSSPFSPELIVVQSQSMARWLRLELAEAHGISANHIFPFPKHFSKLIFTSAFPNLDDGESPYEPSSLVWLILKQLPSLLDNPEFAPLKNYLREGRDPRKLFQLSDKISQLFDQYLIFRPEMILDWDRNQGDGWQPILWRSITSILGKSHPAAMRKAFLDFATKPNAKFSRSPERISIFGISALPKFYLEMFESLAPHLQINFFLLQPCAQWWGYISSDREMQQSLKRNAQQTETAEELHLERGNRLLASLGKQGRDFLNLIHEFEWTETEHFEVPASDTLLHCVQSDIFNLEDRGANGGERQIIARDDASIQIHNCHSPLREMEVLHDQMLDWFQRDPTLTPRDILVMTPDIETYAPFIQAVFDSPETESQRIPLSIADRGVRNQSQIVETFLKILALPQTRLGATTVLALLETPTLRARFGIVGTDLILIRSWIENTGIRWGKNAAHRAALGLPAISDHTWEQGIARLRTLAGSGDESLNDKTLPVLDKFEVFLACVFETFDQLQSSRTLSGWADFLREVIEVFFPSSEQTENELRPIRIALAGFRRNEILSGFDGKIPLDVILEPLTRELNQDLTGAGYLTGGVTFCALKPMRSIPFKIICLVGLNDGTFPRTDSWLSFDLMAQHPRLGDRSSREDDRYLFLETLVSAREKLYISYTGQSIRDNSASPPSVLVSQLLDYVEQGFTLPDANIVNDLVVINHRLQAFSPAYFSGGKLFSYSHENFSASQSVEPDRAAPKIFFTDAIAEPGNEFQKVTVDSLVEFFSNPAKFFATHRLGIHLKRLETELEDDEPFALDALQNYLLKQQMLELRISGQPLEKARELITGGALPAGMPGEAAMGNVRTAVESFYNTLKPHLASLSATPVPVEIVLGDFQVTGEFRDVTSAGLLAFRCTDVKAKDLLRAWIQHAVWNAAQPANQTLKSRLIGTDKVFEFSEIANPKTVLDSLLQIYWRGLAQPLKFFPESSCAFVESEKKALKAWEGNDHSPGDREDEYFNLFFRNTAALNDEFGALAKEIFQPLLAHSKEIAT